MKTQRRRRQEGFTLIELLVVVLIIGILAAIAVPQYFKVVEKGRFSEALSTFQTVKGAQERYLLQKNTYATTATLLDTGVPVLKHFGSVTLAGGANTWSITLTRQGTGAPGGSTYTVSYTGPSGSITCGGAYASCTDMLP